MTDARRIETCFVVRTPGDPANMRQTESRITAVAGAPAAGETTTLDGMWLAVAILGLPTAAVLFATGFRHYGWARSLAVAVAIGGSAIGMILGIVLYGTPVLVVAAVGMLALKMVEGRAAAEFEQVGTG